MGRRAIFGLCTQTGAHDILDLLTKALRAIGIDTRQLYQNLSATSIDHAIKEQNLVPLVQRLCEIVPDVSDQYSRGFDAAEFSRYWEIKLRGQHAFQMKCVIDALTLLGGKQLVVTDIGDSSGNHGIYLDGLVDQDMIKRFVSVNLDPIAVDKVRGKGREAILCRAEELHKRNISPDLMISFEMLEHLVDPIGFLHGISQSTTANYLLVSVPFTRVSRFGGYHLRLSDAQLPMALDPEAVHIHEYNVDDWCLLARFSGWRPVQTMIYRQYPLRSIFRLMAPLWRKIDFEGYVGILLKKDLSLADRYTGW